MQNVWLYALPSRHSSSSYDWGGSDLITTKKESETHDYCDVLGAEKVFCTNKVGRTSRTVRRQPAQIFEFGRCRIELIDA